MLLTPYDFGCPAHAPYLVADEAVGIAAITALPCHIDPYLQDDAPFGLDRCYPFLTHSHADGLADHLQLREHASVTLICLRPHGLEEDGLPPWHRDHDPIGAAGESPWLAVAACRNRGNCFSIAKGVS